MLFSEMFCESSRRKEAQSPRTAHYALFRWGPPDLVIYNVRKMRAFTFWGPLLVM